MSKHNGRNNVCATEKAEELEEAAAAAAKKKKEKEEDERRKEATAAVSFRDAAGIEVLSAGYASDFTCE